MRPREAAAALAAKLGQQRPIRMIVDMDEPDHRKYRALTQSWFLPSNLKRLDDTIKEITREYVDKLATCGGQCDFVKDVAVWFPLRVIMLLLGVPVEDGPLLLRLTQQTFGAEDPDVAEQADFKQARAQAFAEFVDYFKVLLTKRRKEPGEDLASLIANAEIDGKPIPDREALSYYIVIATAGHDTTSATAAGGLLALIENPAEMAKLRADISLLPKAVEEMIRWVTPVKHFGRTAVQDYVLRGQKIEAGQSLMLCYPSANRDEELFEDPFAFRVDREPNKQLAFGIGVHQCLGLHLARQELRAFFAEFLARVDDVRLAGEPAHVAGTFIAGLKRLPISYRMK
jgi:cytochrome P450